MDLIQLKSIYLSKIIEYTRQSFKIILMMSNKGVASFAFNYQLNLMLLQDLYIICQSSLNRYFSKILSRSCHQNLCSALTMLIFTEIDKFSTDNHFHDKWMFRNFLTFIKLYFAALRFLPIMVRFTGF